MCDYRGVRTRKHIYAIVAGLWLAAVLGGQSAKVLAAEGDGDKEGSVDGSWVGEIPFNGQEVKFIFDLKQAPDGLVSGTLRIPLIGPGAMPITNGRLVGRKLSVEVKKVGLYTGRVSLKSGRASGEWTGDKGDKTALDLVRGDQAWSYDRPQTPKAPFPYQVREVQFANPLANNQLAGTLILPEAMGRVPAVVLVSDSGPQDRDATLHDHKTFAVLADYLARKGIASLRYDDRGIGKSTGTFANGTTMDFATDAFAAVDFLKGQKEINPAAIGIVGHGEGGLIASIVAAKRDDVAFLVLLGAPALRGDQTLLIQSDAIGRASGLDEAFLKLSRRLLDSFYKLLTQTPPDMPKAAAVFAEFEKKVEELPQEKQELLGPMGQFLGGQLQQVKESQSPWLAYYVAYDPGPTLQQVKCPVYALTGERDLDVLADIHLPAIKRHLLAGGNDKVATEKLADINHRLQKAETGLGGEYATIDETIEVSVMKKIASWIFGVVGR